MAEHRHVPGRASGAVRIGISGWRYAPWRGHFYPEGLPQDSELAYASRKVCTVEINGTFYSLQKPAFFEHWRDETPGGFVFAVKGPRYITHTLRLRNLDEPLANFFASGVLALREKLGPLLWQFPPTLQWDAGRVEPFLDMLPRDTVAAARMAGRHGARLDGRDLTETDARRPLRHAVEVRHPSFACPQFVDALRRRGIALVTADTAGKWPLLEDATADFAYIRLHGDQALYSSGYSAPAIADWARRIAAWARGATPRGARLAGPRTSATGPRDVYGYFDNDMKVMAPRDARALMSALRLPMEPVPER
ncbi:hypothetical protein CAL26_07575 [Bordetella genomosp. 9]|uniref:DUF72 domain-containing protein n=1 Tax=Bordetella genomosp. 9 TaxID=1416803 RepID=A0A261RE65_9BORD|nr:DUF72 domain-containing protein [Bordetella genomosp. 9]OZI23314.1 hypothetical protein CAL26_07575 [Bordetella genomosp. 9]